jgi:flavorubredoxin
VTTETRNPLPRELAPGIFWLGQCMEQAWEGAVLHNYNSVYLVCGEESSLLVEAGHPQDLPALEAQLEALLERGVAPLRHVFCTHQETPHSSGIARILERHPQVEVCGDVRDYHLVFPGCDDRLRPMRAGESIDLGGTSFFIVEPVIWDLPSTQWGFDSARRVLFPGDGFAYSHYHQAGMCGSTAEEAPELALEDMTGLFAELALYWTRFTDMEPYVTRLETLLARLDVALIAPTHGLPITDRRRTVAAVLEGLRSARSDLDDQPGRTDGR